MYDKKSDYALNKLDRDAIVYRSVTDEYTRITREDFESEDEFLRWKAESDTDYSDTERKQRGDDDCLSLHDGLGIVSLSVEESVFSRLREKEQAEQRALVIEQIKDILTVRQYRRLWMYCVEGMTEEEIGAVEGIAHQNVSKSIRGARKKVFVTFCRKGAKHPR